MRCTGRGATNVRAADAGVRHRSPRLLGDRCCRHRLWRRGLCAGVRHASRQPARHFMRNEADCRPSLQSITQGTCHGVSARGSGRDTWPLALLAAVSGDGVTGVGELRPWYGWHVQLSDAAINPGSMDAFLWFFTQVRGGQRSPAGEGTRSVAGIVDCHCAIRPWLTHAQAQARNAWISCRRSRGVAAERADSIGSA